MALSVALKAGQRWNIVELGGMLLRLCRLNAAQIRSDSKSPPAERLFREARRSASSFFNTIGDEDLENEETKALAELADCFEPRLGEGTTARALALGLDEALGDRFCGLFRGRTVRLAADSPCPVALPPLKDLYGHLCTDPDAASDPIDRTPRLCLGPRDIGGIEVCLSFEHEDHLSRLRHGTKLGAALPNAGISDLKFARFTKEGLPHFYDVRPRDAEDQSGRIRRLLNKAMAAGVDVLVLPELCADKRVIDEVRAWRREHPPSAISVIVAGSRHVELVGDGPGENEALIIFSTGEERTHHKICPYILRDKFHDDDTPAAEEILRREYISGASNTVTVHYSGDWSMSVVICKDLLDAALLRVLEDLRVRLVLVPSCSDKTDLLEQHASQLGRHAQAAVVVANLTASTDAARAIFAIPAKLKGIFISRASDSAEAPVLCVLQTQPKPSIFLLAV